MIADDTAYQYLKENNVDLFAEPSEFDGEHGIMAYNRTLQRPGKLLRFARWKIGLWQWGNIPALSPVQTGYEYSLCWT